MFFFFFLSHPPGPRAKLTEAAFVAGACGNALGSGVEFAERGSFPLVLSMQDAPGHLPVGQWSDDTGLMLCLARSLIELRDFSPLDQMERYLRFFDKQEGWDCETPLAPGRTTASALERFRESRDPFSGSTGPHALGNGALTRILPLSVVAHEDKNQLRTFCRDATRTTHGTELCQQASECLGLIQAALIDGRSKEEALHAAQDVPWSNDRLRRVAGCQYAKYEIEAISSSGYVLDTLEAALWCFAKRIDTRDAVLTAVNLGGDCDTVATITGQLCGLACHGLDIPGDWLQSVRNLDYIREIAHQVSSLKLSGPGEAEPNSL